MPVATESMHQNQVPENAQNRDAKETDYGTDDNDPVRPNVSDNPRP